MKKLLQLLKKDERGLTLVELLAVIVILAIVGAIAFVSIGNVIENSKQDAHVANAQQLISAAKLYEASTGDIPAGGVTTKVEAERAENQAALDTIEKLTNPWDADDTTYVGTVTKDGEVYKVTIDGSELKCEISDETEAGVIEGRDAVCDSGSQAGS